MSVKQLSETFGISCQVVYNRRRKAEETTVFYVKAKHQPVTLDQIRQKRAELQRQLEDVSKVEQRLIDERGCREAT
jgi:transposase